MTPAETANYLINTTVDMAHAVEDAAWLDILEGRIAEVLTRAETRACAAEERAARAEAVCAAWRVHATIRVGKADTEGTYAECGVMSCTGDESCPFGVADDAGATLLAAVRRLVEIWSRRDSQDQEWWDDMNEALADPALKIAHLEPK